MYSLYKIYNIHIAHGDINIYMYIYMQLCKVKYTTTPILIVLVYMVYYTNICILYSTIQCRICYHEYYISMGTNLRESPLLDISRKSRKVGHQLSFLCHSPSLWPRARSCFCINYRPTIWWHDFYLMHISWRSLHPYMHTHPYMHYNVKKCFSSLTVSLSPSSITLGWMHMFLRADKHKARTFPPSGPIIFVRYSMTLLTSSIHFAISGTVLVQ